MLDAASSSDDQSAEYDGDASNAVRGAVLTHDDASTTTAVPATDGTPSLLSNRQRKVVCDMRLPPRRGHRSETTSRIKLLQSTRVSEYEPHGPDLHTTPTVIDKPLPSSGACLAEPMGVGVTTASIDVERVKNKAQRIESSPRPIPPDGDILDDRDVADVDELYSENELALSSFIKLHPMLR